MPDASYSRISITLPPEVLASANRLARALDRPRSWVFAEAMRRFGNAESLLIPVTSGEPPRVQPEAERAAGSARLDADTMARLPADLLLSPEERVHAAEAQARASSGAPKRPADQILSFKRFEEYLRWSERVRSRE